MCFWTISRSGLYLKKNHPHYHHLQSTVVSLDCLRLPGNPATQCISVTRTVSDVHLSAFHSGFNCLSSNHNIEPQPSIINPNILFHEFTVCDSLICTDSSNITIVYVQTVCVGVQKAFENGTSNQLWASLGSRSE